MISYIIQIVPGEDGTQPAPRIVRFITGKASHNAHEITTPTATIGVRGTAFDVYVGDGGELAVAMINGAVEGVSRRAVSVDCTTSSDASCT